jgi:hypothetical protein
LLFVYQWNIFPIPELLLKTLKIVRRKRKMLKNDVREMKKKEWLKKLKESQDKKKRKSLEIRLLNKDSLEKMLNRWLLLLFILKNRDLKSQDQE